jgi:hypothetical protein
MRSGTYIRTKRNYFKNCISIQLLFLDWCNKNKKAMDLDFTKSIFTGMFLSGPIIYIIE